MTTWVCGLCKKEKSYMEDMRMEIKGWKGSVLRINATLCVKCYDRCVVRA